MLYNEAPLNVMMTDTTAQHVAVPAQDLQALEEFCEHGLDDVPPRLQLSHWSVQFVCDGLVSARNLCVFYNNSGRFF